MKLDLTNQSRSIDLGHGVTVDVRPGASAIVVAAGADVAATGDRGRVAFAKAVARHAITGWTGVEDADGAAIATSPEAIDALLEVWPIFSAFEARYVAVLLVVVTEGND